MSTLGAPYPRLSSPLPAQAPASDQSDSLAGVVLAAILVYLLLVPEQFNLTLAGIYLSPFRIFLMLGSLYVLAAIGRRRIRFVWPDLLIALGVAWIWLAAYMTSGSMAISAEMGGSHTVDIGLAYFLARSTIRSPVDLRRFLILIAPGAFFIGCIVVAESVSHTMILQRLASAVTGAPHPTRFDVRLGLMRGFGSFPHPILAGICLASLVPIYLLSGLRGWPWLVGVLAGLSAFFTLSSAALLGLIAGGFLSFYDWLSERIGNLSWRVFLFLAAIFFGLVEIGSNSGSYSLLVRYASLNTATAYNRVLIWDFGTDNIERHPWFGIGYSDWDRPEWMLSGSFDHFWLIMALRWGIPEFLFLFGATATGLVMLMLKSGAFPSHDARLMRGVAISVGVFALGINSVSLWMASLAWFFLLLGIAVSLSSNDAPVPSRPKATT